MSDSAPQIRPASRKTAVNQPIGMPAIVAVNGFTERLGPWPGGNFRRFYAGYATSLLGTAMSAVAIAFALLGERRHGDRARRRVHREHRPDDRVHARRRRARRPPRPPAGDAGRRRGPLRGPGRPRGHAVPRAPGPVAVRRRRVRGRCRQRVLPAGPVRPARAARPARPAGRRERAVRHGPARRPGRGPGPGRDPDRRRQPGPGDRGRRRQLRGQRARPGLPALPPHGTQARPGRCCATWPTAGRSSPPTPGSGCRPSSSRCSTC